MIKIIGFIVLIQALFPVGVSGQSGSQLSLAGGYWSFGSRDEQASPFTYSGSAVSPQLLYQYRGQDYHVGAQLTFGAADLVSALTGTIGGESHSGEVVRVGMRFSVAKRITSLAEDDYPLFVGIAWNTTAAFKTYSYARGLPEETIVDALSGIELVISLHHTMASGSVELAGRAFLVGLVFDHPYAVTDALGAEATNRSYLSTFLRFSRFRTLLDVAALQSTISYRYDFSEVFSGNVAYELSYYRFTHHWKGTTIENRFLVGAGVSF